jgi:hypothetical protein
VARAARTDDADRCQAPDGVAMAREL